MFPIIKQTWSVASSCRTLIYGSTIVSEGKTKDEIRQLMSRDNQLFKAEWKLHVPLVLKISNSVFLLLQFTCFLL
jgi:hypothetical protein